MKMNMTEHPLRTRTSRDPQCFKLLDAVNTVGENAVTTAPETGDFTICIACASVLRFDDNLGLVLCSLSEVPIEIRARLAFVKMTVEEAARRWNAKGGKPWCKGD